VVPQPAAEPNLDVTKAEEVHGGAPRRTTKRKRGQKVSGADLSQDTADSIAAIKALEQRTRDSQPMHNEIDLGIGSHFCLVKKRGVVPYGKAATEKWCTDNLGIQYRRVADCVTFYGLKDMLEEAELWFVKEAGRLNLALRNPTGARRGIELVKLFQKFNTVKKDAGRSIDEVGRRKPRNVKEAGEHGRTASAAASKPHIAPESGGQSSAVGGSSAPTRAPEQTPAPLGAVRRVLKSEGWKGVAKYFGGRATKAEALLRQHGIPFRLE
jgi:hypothetical protein